MTGVGRLTDNRMHVIDFAGWLLGDVDTFAGFASNLSRRKPGYEDNRFALIRSAAGRIASVQSSWTEWRGNGWRMKIFGTSSAIRLGFPAAVAHASARHSRRKDMKAKHHPILTYQFNERLKGWQWSLIETMSGDLRNRGEAIRPCKPAPASHWAAT